jgi:polysaccharide biosynthesis/export protein
MQDSFNKKVKITIQIINSNNMYNIIKHLRLLSQAIILIAITSACVTQKDLEYFQKSERIPKSFNEAEVLDYRLKPNDELYIQINSLDDAISNMFSSSANQQAGNMMSISPYGASLISYSINKEGFLQLPIIGDVQVANRTLEEVRLILTDSLSHILSQPIVTVKLVNRYVSVLGEVRTPGHFPYSQDKLSIYDAIGLAGDMTIWSDRKEVKLTRNENGKNTLVYLDLTNPEILSSNYYYLRPNDIIYVKPLKKRIWGMSEFPFAIILSTLSVTLLFYSVVK